MLYISRFIGRNKYGVVDTDDNVETAVTYQELKEIVNLGIEIKGVTTRDEYNYSLWDTEKVIWRIDPWQVDEHAAGRSMKAKMMLGVDVVVNNGVITSVNWDDNVAKNGTRVRLSDFGTKCADCILTEYRNTHVNRLIVVLDDKVQLHANTLFGFFRLDDVSLDISEVTRKKTVNLAYKAWGSYDFPPPLRQSIIDKPERMAKFEAISYVITTTTMPLMDFSEEITAGLDDLFYDEFKRFANSRFQLGADISVLTELNHYRYELSCEQSFWKSDEPASFADVLQRDRFHVFEFLMLNTTCGTQTAQRFLNYLQYFKPTPKMAELYVLLCKRVSRWVLSGGKKW